MIKEISPNVTMVYNTEINNVIKKISSNAKFSHKSFIYDNGVVVIDSEFESNVGSGTSNTQSNTYYTDMIQNAVQRTFSEYKLHNHLYPVSRTGLKVNGFGDEIGSVRFCTNNTLLSEFINDIIVSSDAFSSFYQNSIYTGVSPYFRFMQYSSGGSHFPHYDSDYSYSSLDDEITTRYSMVLYFTDCQTGEIAFINDKTPHAVDRSDWERQATDDEIWLKVKPKAMRLVLFPHDLCHTVLTFDDGEGKKRTMVRGDLEFRHVK